MFYEMLVFVLQFLSSAPRAMATTSRRERSHESRPAAPACDDPPRCRRQGSLGAPTNRPAWRVGESVCQPWVSIIERCRKLGQNFVLSVPSAPLISHTLWTQREEWLWNNHSGDWPPFPSDLPCSTKRCLTSPSRTRRLTKPPQRRLASFVFRFLKKS